MEAKGCYYCPGDGRCTNYDLYTYSNKVSTCGEDDYLSSVVYGHTRDSCIPDFAYTNDPLYEGNDWMYEMINIVDVWDMGYFGDGIKIRINDDGVYVSNKEFYGRFDDVENSCDDYLPINDSDDHGTAVAGIILGNANNDLCATGIAPKAKFSSCNFFSGVPPSELLAYKFETFDISQNSIGVP